MRTIQPYRTLSVEGLYRIGKTDTRQSPSTRALVYHSQTAFLSIRKNFMGILRQSDFADVQRVGIPRALLYHRYGTLWETFFRELGREVILSRETDRALMTAGEALSVDECCLASKVYLGHAASLVDKCDALFVPSIENLGRLKGFCTKFQALPDLVENTLYDRQVRIVSCLVSQTHEHISMKDAFLTLAGCFGASSREAKHAWRTASHAQERVDRTAASAQERLLTSFETIQGGERPLVILLAAHPYLSHDAYLGSSISDSLRHMGATVIYADQVDQDRTLKASLEFSETLPWIVNRELIGAIMLLHERIDGIVLVSAFPCGPDSMTDDAIMRCIQGKPILNLTIDAQSGTAGLETRIESFTDILRYQKKGGYVHA